MTGEISRDRQYIGSLFDVFQMYFTLYKGTGSDIVTASAGVGKLGAFVQMVFFHFEGMGAKVF